MAVAGSGLTNGTEPADQPIAAPYATVLVPTFRRADRLRLTLDDLRTQTCGGGWELLIVDNDPAGSARAVVDAAAAGFPVPLRYVVEPINGAAHARNRGLAEAVGQVLAMCDDDVVPHPGWLERLVAPLRERRYDGVGGAVELDPAAWRPSWFTDDGIGRYLAYFSLGDTERRLAPEEFVLTANAAFRLDLLRECGGFDPSLGPRQGVQIVNDDKQLCRSFRGVGGTLGYLPDVIVTHELPAARLRFRWICQRVYWQGRSDFLLDRATLEGRRFGGMRAALEELRWEINGLLRTGRHRQDVWLHIFLTLLIFGGKAREAAAWRLGSAAANRRGQR